MVNKLAWLIYLGITIFLFWFIIFQAKIEPAGDIAEYFGITESLINHQSLELTTKDQKNLSQSLHPDYFQDPGYYIEGVNRKKYPVHFVFYSVLAVPVRLGLRFFRLDQLKTLAVTNLIIFSLIIFLVMRFFLKSSWQKILFLALIYLSPLVFFLTWPGPDIFYLSLLLLAVYLFYSHKYFLSALLVVLASWHSQPLIALAGSSILVFFIKKRNLPRTLFLVFLIAIPYIYNYLAFGVLTPWTIFADGWTTLHGFGLQNVSLKKLYEQLFDLNIGLFWYAPLISLAGFYYVTRRSFWISLLILLTALIYQTNPAWHYGTAGFGPTRHILFVLPILIFFITRNLKFNFTNFNLVGLIITSQLFVLSSNGFISPNFQNSLRQNALATFVLDNYPKFYQPTPEIFVDRTNQTDLKYPTSAIYKKAGFCQKAYVLKQDAGKLISECGFLPVDWLWVQADREGYYVDF